MLPVSAPPRTRACRADAHCQHSRGGCQRQAQDAACTPVPHHRRALQRHTKRPSHRRPHVWFTYTKCPEQTHPQTERKQVVAGDGEGQGRSGEGLLTDMGFFWGEGNVLKLNW